MVNAVNAGLGQRRMGIGGFLVLSLLALGPPGSLGNPTREMQLLSAMEKVLDALGSRIDEMYTDSAFGLRFADDQLHVLLEHLEAGGPPTPPVALDAIRAVQVKAHRYARAAAVVVDTSSSTRKTFPTPSCVYRLNMASCGLNLCGTQVSPASFARVVVTSEQRRALIGSD
ncbi:hypothetical protein ISCGN_032894 [Ixodes scapularis]